jgi:DNA-binding NarL/FixJ family response regulator
MEVGRGYRRIVPSSSTSGAVMIGRAHEQAVVADTIGRARNGVGASLVVTGEPGIGKTALLDYAVDRADEFRVLRACGLAGEKDLSFVVLADLAAPILNQLPKISPRHASILKGALALGPPTGADRFGVAVSVLSLLTVAAERAPLLVLVDDCQWVDPSSLSCLVFAARRLDADRVGLIFACRSTDQGIGTNAAFDGLEHLSVMPLDEQEALELVTREVPAASRVHMVETVERAQGNPLAIIQLASNPVLGATPVEPASIGERLANAFAEELDRMPRATQDALDVLAVMGDTRPGPIRSLLDALGIDPVSLEPAEDADIIRASPDRVSFRHPLIQMAAYQRIPPPKRRRLHAAIADWLRDGTGASDSERRAWHATAGTLGPDEALAQELERVSEQAKARSSIATAVRLLERSALMSESARDRTLRLVRAADTAQAAGLLEDASQLLDRALANAPDGGLDVPTRYMRCRIDMWRGLPVEGRDALRHLANSQAAVSPAKAATMYADAALTSIFLGDARAALDCMDRAVSLVSHRPSVPAIEAVDALVAMVTGSDARGTQSLQWAVGALQPSDRLSTHQEPLLVALAMFAKGDVGAALAEIDTTVLVARDASALGLLPFQLSRLSAVQMAAGQWSAALSSAQEALDLARQTGWHTEVPMALAALARVEAGMGREEQCCSHVDELLAIAQLTGIDVLAAYGRLALGLLALGRSDAEDAAGQLDQVRQFSTSRGLIDNPILPWATDLAEAHAKTGEHAMALALLRQLEQSGLPSLRSAGAAERVRAHLARDADATERHLERSISLAGEDHAVFEQARSLLAMGQLHRRSRQPRRARQPLVAAVAHFEQLGAQAWSEQARAELRATGTPVAAKSPELGELTPQEMSVARAVAQGLSNRQAADQLFLSVRTVEFHLTSTYRKLGINRRAQLARFFPVRPG